MDPIRSIDSLALKDGLKKILKKHGVYTVDGFLCNAIGIFRECFELTCEDWLDIADTFTALKAVSKINDSAIRAAIGGKGCRKDPAQNALVVNVFNEKYVVSTFKKEKRMYDDLIYKALSKGIVFLSEEDAQRFADRICENCGSAKYVREIDNAQQRIYVIEAYSSRREESTIFYQIGDDMDDIPKIMARTGTFLEPLRAHLLAGKAVERIDRIYDYEIASLMTVICDEEKGTVKRVDAVDTMAAAKDENAYIDIQKYVKALDGHIEKEGQSPFVWGKNAALEQSKQKPAQNILKRIEEHALTLEEYRTDAGATEDDMEYVRGFLEGARIALEVQRESMVERMEANVAVIDHFDILEKNGLDPAWLATSFTEGNCTVGLRLFPSAEALSDTVEDHRAYYVIWGDHPSTEEERALFQLRCSFYETYGKALYTLPMHKDFKNIVLSELFVLRFGDKEEEL